MNKKAILLILSLILTLTSCTLKKEENKTTKPKSEIVAEKETELKSKEEMEIEVKNEEVVKTEIKTEVKSEEVIETETETEVKTEEEERDERFIIIENYLYEKYNEEFLVDYVEVEKKVDNSFMVVAYSKNNINKPFEIKISNNLKEINDRYSSRLAEIELEKQASEIFSEHWSEYFLEATVHTIYTQVNYRDYNNLPEYFNKSDSIDSFEIYIKQKEELNKENEASKILKFYEEYKKLGTKTATGIFYYIKEDTFNKMDEEYYSIKDKYQYYINEENSYNHAIIGGEKIEILSEDVILKSFGN